MAKVMFYVDLSKVRVNSGVLSVLLPQAIRSLVESRLAVNEKEKYKFVFDFQKKKKPRSTGWKSQCNHLHGHLSQIADHCGYYMSEIKEAMKEDLPDWPRKAISIGGARKIVYMSEADADTVLESKAIEWCHVKAAELGIILIEEE